MGILRVESGNIELQKYYIDKIDNTPLSAEEVLDINATLKKIIEDSGYKMTFTDFPKILNDRDVFTQDEAEAIIYDLNNIIKERVAKEV